MAVLPLGLGSIHITEKLRWYESKRSLWLVAAAASGAFATACALLTIHSRAGDMNSFGSPETGFFATYARNLLQMAFLTFFLVAAVYLLHCTEWVLTRLGRKVYMDELFSRLLALGIFAAATVLCYLALTLLLAA
jgi:hypothetical protein